MKVFVAATIMLQVLTVGVHADPAGLLTCVLRPLWLVRIIVAMFVAVPLLAAALVKISRAPLGMKALWIATRRGHDRLTTAALGPVRPVAATVVAS